MAAVVTDQFRIFNADNFVNSVLDDNNSYYVFLGLANPTATGFGRDSTWETSLSGPPSPTDNTQYLNHYRDTALFGKRISSENIRRVVRKVQWTSNVNYDMYRHDYSALNPTPNSGTTTLYNSDYYVITSEFRVYICLYNGSSGDKVEGEASLYEPNGTDIEPVPYGDGYVWKYLFSISPNDVIKFDSTEYIVLPNNWSTNTDSQIADVRDAGDNNDQIKTVYIKHGGSGYSTGTYDILGDGTGARVQIEVDRNTKIISANVTEGGSDYTWGIVDLERVGNISDPATLIPIIPPSRGHGYDIYTELGADRVLIYARFDDSTKDFPVDTKFAQVGIVKNVSEYSDVGIGTIYKGSTYSSLYSLKLSGDFPTSVTPQVGDEVTQNLKIDGVDYKAKGYVASWDKDTKVLKYYRDRSLYFPNKVDQRDAENVGVGIGTTTNVVNFVSGDVTVIGAGSTSIDSSFNGTTFNGINLGVNFTGGLATPEINKKTGTIIYIDNRPEVERNLRQKEDVKIILEF
jgi:hypothetical protein